MIEIEDARDSGASCGDRFCGSTCVLTKGHDGPHVSKGPVFSSWTDPVYVGPMPPRTDFRIDEEKQERVEQLQAQLENVLDSSKEGTWMARALDAERELKDLKDKVGKESSK